MTVIVEPIKGVEIRIRAVIYVRISSRNQDIKNSSSAQIAAGKAFKEKGCYCPNRNSFYLDKRVMDEVMNDILSDTNITHLIDQIRADTDQSNVDYAQLMSDLDKGLAQIGRRQDRALQAFELDTITQEKYLERMIELKAEEQRLEKEKATAEAIMGDEITILTDPKSVEDYATQVRGFLETVDPSEWKPIIRKFVRNVSLGYEQGIITYKIPLPDDNPFARRMTSTIDLSGKVLSSVQSDPGTKG